MVLKIDLVLKTKEYKFYTKMNYNGELDPEYMGRVDIDVNKIKFIRKEE